LGRSSGFYFSGGGLDGGHLLNVVVNTGQSIAGAVVLDGESNPDGKAFSLTKTAGRCEGSRLPPYQDTDPRPAGRWC
jgi:hypothetical protein